MATRKCLTEVTFDDMATSVEATVEQMEATSYEDVKPYKAR